MEDMYDKIRDKLNNSAEVKATDQNWANFLNHRKAKDGGSPRKAMWPYWAIASLVLLLGVSNIYWAMQDGNTYHAINTNSESVDTVYITKYIENPNTTSNSNQEITQLENVANKLALMRSQYEDLKTRLNNPIGSIQLQSFKNEMESKYATLQSQWNSIIQADRTQIQDFANDKIVLTAPIFESKLEDRIFFNTIDQLPTIGLQNIAYHSKALYYRSSIFIKKNKKPFDLLDAITPATFSINGNVANAFNPWIDNYNGLALDFRAITLFSKTVRGYIGFTFASSQSRLDDDNTSNPDVPYPVLPEGDEIESSDESLSQVSINVGLEYLLNLDSRWRPYAGLGYGRVIKNYAKYSFEIEAPDGNEYYITPDDNFPLEGYDQMIFTLGTDFNLSNRIDIRLGLNYTYGFHEAHKTNFFLKVGGYYHF